MVGIKDCHSDTHEVYAPRTVHMQDARLTYLQLYLWRAE